MKLFNEKEIESKARELFLGTGNQSAFLTGVIYSEKITLPLFVEFTTWCAGNYIPISDGNGLNHWVEELYRKPDAKYSTDQLFEIWIKTKP